ncbi:hypothetical protein WCLP8_4240010 [uncultured Gammaproteobacteria bacterium]
MDNNKGLPSKRSKPTSQQEVSIVRDVSLAGVVDNSLWDGSKVPFGIVFGNNATNTDIKVTMNIALMPQASELEKLEQIAPGIGKSVIDAFNDQRHHRMEIEMTSVLRDESRRDRGQIVGGLISLFGLGAATFLGVYGNPWVATVLAVVAMGGPLAAQQLAGTLFKGNVPASAGMTGLPSSPTVKANQAHSPPAKGQ